MKTEANTIAILCDLDEAEMLGKVAKHFCPEAVPQIDKAIRLAVSGDGELLEATTPEQIKQKMDELAKKYVETHDSEIIKTLDSLALDLGKIGKLKTQ